MRALRYTARTTAVAAVTAGLVVAASGSAWAHECFVANRSQQGDAAVSAHSAAWFTITPEFLFSEIIPLSGDAFTCAVNAWKTDPSLPPYLVVGGKQAVGQGGVIAENNPNFASGKASDGQGIDHAVEVFGPTIDAIVARCTT
jgi:hypothetical protein